MEPDILTFTVLQAQRHLEVPHKCLNKNLGSLINEKLFHLIMLLCNCMGKYRLSFHFWVLKANFKVKSTSQQLSLKPGNSNPPLESRTSTSLSYCSGLVLGKFILWDVHHFMAKNSKSVTAYNCQIILEHISSVMSSYSDQKCYRHKKLQFLSIIQMNEANYGRQYSSI